ncbi:hypothetical protein FGO68_gene3923 [Halteria grandinella]|uniref:Uncharacterized protein n=1 Tax=Halteria grandinella TaxID=5974 RepID=A0A8J8NK31_HALGN|nr:hypothetical protein FGO68_gene3923 [Halteria grandinella]
MEPQEYDNTPSFKKPFSKEEEVLAVKDIQRDLNECFSRKFKNDTKGALHLAEMIIHSFRYIKNDEIETHLVHVRNFIQSMIQPQVFNYEEQQFPQITRESPDSIIKPITLLALGAAGVDTSRMQNDFAGKSTFITTKTTDELSKKEVATYTGNAFNKPEYKHLNLIDTPPCDEIIRDFRHKEKIQAAIQSFKPTILGLLFVWDWYKSIDTDSLNVLVQFKAEYPQAKVFFVYTNTDSRPGEIAIREKVQYLADQGVKITIEDVIQYKNKPQSLQKILEVLKKPI